MQNGAELDSGGLEAIQKRIDSLAAAEKKRKSPGTIACHPAKPRSRTYVAWLIPLYLA